MDFKTIELLGRTGKVGLYLAGIYVVCQFGYAVKKRILNSPQVDLNASYGKASFGASFSGFNKESNEKSNKETDNETDKETNKTTNKESNGKTNNKIDSNLVVPGKKEWLK